MLKQSYEWPYLLHEEFDKRYLRILPFLKSKKILEVGSNTSKILDLMPDKFLTTVDVLPTNSQKNNWDHFHGEISKYSPKSESGEYDLIIMGGNCIPLYVEYIQAKKTIESLWSLASKANLVVVEYPLRFWPAKIENEFLISALADHIFMDEIRDYSVLEIDIPRHAALRRMVVFKPKMKTFQAGDIETFRNLRFPNQLIGKNRDFNETLNSTRLRLSRHVPRVLVIDFKRWSFILGFSRKWNYLATYQNDKITIALKLRMFNLGATTNIGILEENELNIERVLNKKISKIEILLSKGETLLLRCNYKSGIIITIIHQE